MVQVHYFNTVSGRECQSLALLFLQLFQLTRCQLHQHFVSSQLLYTEVQYATIFLQHQAVLRKLFTFPPNESRTAKSHQNSDY